MFQLLIDRTDQAITDYVFSVWRAFNSTANAWVTSLMVIFVALVGYLILTGRIEISLSELFPRFVKLLLIFVVLVNADVMINVVYELFTSVPVAISNFLITNSNAASTTDVHALVDNVLARGLNTASLIIDDMGWRGWLIGLPIWLLTFVFVGYVTFLLMLAKLAVAVLLALAPFFIALILFDSARPFFEGWLRQVSTFAIIPILLYSLLGLMLGILDTITETMENAGAEVSLTEIAPFLITLIVAILLNTQILSWAAGICGGFALATQGAFGRTTNGAGRATVAAGRGSYSRGRTLYHHLKNRRRAP